MALKDKLMTLEDFKAVRDVDVASNSAQFTEIKADLGVIQTGFFNDYIFTTEPTWSAGGLNVTTGGPMNMATAIKTGYVTDIGFDYIQAENTKLVVVAFDDSNTYLGVWNGNEFVTPTNNKASNYYVSGFNMTNLPTGTAKIRVAYYGSTDTTEASKVRFLTPIKADVETLKNGVATIENRVATIEDSINTPIIHNNFINTIYSWWIYPVGIYVDRIRKCLYVGYVDNEGYQGIVSKNVTTGIVTRHVFRKSGADDHNGVSVNMLPDGRIMAICTGHAETRAHYCYISKRAEDISEWDSVINIPLPEGYNYTSYTQVVRVGDNWYMFYRCKGAIDGYDYWGYSVSADGVTWGNDVIFLAGLNKKYYCRVAPYDGTTVKLFMQSNYSVGETDIRMGYIDLATGEIYNADHVSVLTPPVVYTDFSIVVAKGDKRLRLYDVLPGTDNSLVYARLNATGNGYVSIYARYDNGVLTEYEMPSQGAVFTSGYQNGVAFISKDSFVVCRNLSDHWSVDLYDFSSGVFTLRKNLDVTASSDVKMMRPVKVNSDYALCNRGTYSEYTVYDCDINVLNLT